MAGASFCTRSMCAPSIATVPVVLVIVIAAEAMPCVTSKLAPLAAIVTGNATTNAGYVPGSTRIRSPGAAAASAWSIVANGWVGPTRSTAGANATATTDSNVATTEFTANIKAIIAQLPIERSGIRHRSRCLRPTGLWSGTSQSGTARLYRPTSASPRLDVNRPSAFAARSRPTAWW